LPLLLLAAAAPAQRDAASGPRLPFTPFELCDAALVAARSKPIPQTLLPSIARVESGRLDAASGRVRPWPWTINVDGAGTFFGSKEEAIAAVQALQARGRRSIDVGCMQVNLMFHPHAFPTLEAAFDPRVNAVYAARFLTALHDQTRDWPLATAMYHSQTQDRGEDYQRLVFGRVITPMGPSGTASGTYAAFRPAGAMFAALPPVNLAFGAFAAPRRNRPDPSLLRGTSVVAVGRHPGSRHRATIKVPGGVAEDRHHHRKADKQR
jgi:hypothetical protein